jgi:hypothetical protein
MNGMSLEAEEIARREVEIMEEPDKVRVYVRTSWTSGMCLPDPEGDSQEEAVFQVLTYGDNFAIEKACWYEEERPGGGKQRETDFNEFRRLMLKRNLLWWSLNVPIERKNGWMTKESYQRVSRVAAPLVECFIREYERKFEVTKDEEQIVSRQASVLFSRNGRGVSDACEAIGMYCSVSGFWDKFGMSLDELRALPYREFVLLKMMLSHEGEAHRRNSQPKKDGNTRIAGAGGKIRQSRGVKVPM